MRIWTYCFALFFICCSSLPKQKHTSFSGIFTTYKPGILDQVRTERRFSGHIYPLPAAMIYFRPDSTYVMGFCDNQIREAGKYSCHDDVVLLYDRYNLEEKMKIGERTMYFDNERNIFYFITPNPKNAGKRLSNNIIPLKKNHTYAHVGFLRGQEISLDSLIQYYQQKSVDDQNKWTDSVWNSAQSKL